MPIPLPQRGENRETFMDRCMSDASMMEDYPEEPQRVAVCLGTWTDAARSVKAWSVGAARDLPIEEGDRAWDGPAAEQSIFDHAGGEDFDPIKARRGFLVYDTADPTLRGSYKLPIARAGGGGPGLVVPKSGIRAAASRLPQTDIPGDVRSRAQAVIDHYKKKAGMDEEGDDKKGLRIKSVSAPPPGESPFEFVMSDASVDRVGDIIDQKGWELANFRRNPIALFGHNASFPIGKWRDVAVIDGRLQGRLELLDPVSERLRELHAAVAAGVLRAVSVGFRSDEFEPIKESKVGGTRFMRSELIECSLVSVPANPNALAVVRALGILPEGQKLIFSGGLAAEKTGGSRGLNGGLAESQISRKPNGMHTHVSDRIEGVQSQVTALRDQLSTLLGGDELDDGAIAELNGRIESQQRLLASLEASEKLLGNGAVPTLSRPSSSSSNGSNLPVLASQMPRPFAAPKKAEEPGYLMMRVLVCRFIATAERHKGLTAEQVMRQRYGDDPLNRAMLEVYQEKAATVPATSTQAGWAAELFHTQYGEFFDALLPESIYGPLTRLGLRATLGRYGQLYLPTRLLTPAIAGAFVQEGAPIPVKQGAFSHVTIGLLKMAVITSYTREMAEHSTPMIEMLLRQQIQDDTSIAIDSVLTDANPATAIRPAGLRNGISGLTPTAGGGYAALVADLKQLIGVLAGLNSMRRLVWIMNPAQKVSIAFSMSPLGNFPFRAEIENNMLSGYPVIVSSTMPAGTVILMDAADFVSLSGDDPRFEVSDQATLHMEDTTPQQIGTVGTPNVVAAPARNMFQTDSMALRMILPMNWIMRRPVITYVSGITW